MSESLETEYGLPSESTRQMSSEKPVTEEQLLTEYESYETVPSPEPPHVTGPPKDVDEKLAERLDTAPVKKTKTKTGKKKKDKKIKKLKVHPPISVEEEEVDVTSSLASDPLKNIEADMKKLLMRGAIPPSASSASDKFTLSHSLSTHSEDSTSSREEISIKKGGGESVEDEFNFEEKHKFCYNAVKENQEIPPDLRLSIQTLLQKYQTSLEKNNASKEKAESELVKLKQKIVNGEERANELQKEVNTLQKKLDSNEKNINDLKKELDESHEREHDLIDQRNMAHEKIKHLDSDLAKKQLEDQLREEGSDMPAKSRDAYTKEITRLKQDLDLNESRLQLNLQEFEELFKKFKEKESECNELEELMKGHKYDVLREIQKSKVLEADLERVTEDLRNLKLTIAKHYKTFKNASQELMKKDEEVFELRKNNRQLNNKTEEMVKLLTELKERLELSSNNYFKLEEEYKRLKSVCTSQTGDLTVIRKKSGEVEQAQDRWLNRIMNAERKKTKAIADAKRLFNEMKDMAHDAQKKRLSIIKLNRTIAVSKKENNILMKQFKSLEGVVEQQKNQIDEGNQQLYELTAEFNQLKTVNKTQENSLNECSRNNEKLMKEKMILEQVKYQMENDLQDYSIENLNLDKEVRQKIDELTHMEKMYQTAASDKKYLEKKLLETKWRVTDLNNKNKIIFQEMELVKDQLHKKQQDYEKLLSSNQKDVFTKDAMISKLNNCMENRKNLLKTIEEKESETKQRVDIIIKKETHISELLLEIDTLKRQAGDLKTVLQKRNAELSLVYEKTDLMKYILENGKEQYQQRLKDIELLKREIRKLRADKKVLINLAENTPNLRLEMFHLHKDLTKERQKCRALEEQMENPLNIHRWRLLEGKDPDKRDLIEKNQILQKKLIRVEEDNSIVRNQCASMEMLYLNMRTYLNKLPGKDSAQYLEEAKRCLRDKTKENRRLSSLLGAYENELAQLKKKMEETKRESLEIKEKFYKMKRLYDKGKNGIKKNHQEQNISESRQKVFPCGFRITQGQ